MTIILHGSNRPASACALGRTLRAGGRDPLKILGIHQIIKGGCSRRGVQWPELLGMHQSGVQSEGGAMEGGSII